MVDFETIPNAERVDLLKTIAEQVNEYFQNPNNEEKNQTQIKKEVKRTA